MNEKKVNSIAEMWNIPLGSIENIKLSVQEFLREAVSSRDNLSIFERDELDAPSAIKAASFLIRKMIEADLITSFPIKINTVTQGSVTFEEQTEIKSKIRSASVIWVQELCAGELNSKQQAELYCFLSSIFSERGRVIISTSVSPETLADLIGLTNIKLISRNSVCVQI